MIKPCTGYPPEVGARFVEESARGGVDLIKDDELLADPTFARVADRARAYASTLDRMADETGHRARYVANVTTRPAGLIDTARAALEGGADALMVNGLATGLDAVQALAEADLGVPLLVHTAGIETFTTPTAGGYGHRLLLGRLARLAGADAVLSSTPWAPRPLEMSRYRAVLDGCRDDWHALRPTLPMVGGGIRARPHRLARRGRWGRPDDRRRWRDPGASGWDRRRRPGGDARASTTRSRASSGGA